MGADVSDAINRSVEIGYRVIEDYLHRGQEAAERLRQGRYGADMLRDDLQDVAGRLITHVSDFAATWIELIERSGVNARPNVPPRDPPAPAPAAPEPDPTSPVRLEIVTRRPAEATLNLRPLPADRRLVVHALRLLEPDSPRITEVRFIHAPPHPGVIRVAVPDEHPAGTYSGLIVDEATNRPVGALTIVLRDA